ncbi:MAG: RDD family protein [Bacteroidota bacterium]
MEILNSETGKPANLFYAGFWLRFVAYIFDYILVVVIIFISIIIIYGTHAFKISPFALNPLTYRHVSHLPYALIAIIIKWFYFAGFESSKMLATPGKAAAGIIVTDLYGNRISFAKATIRFFGKIISGLILYIGFIIAGLTERKQALHDKLANTLVIRG